MSGYLHELIVASGYSGVAGQTFRNHVASAATGVKTTDYKVTGWVVSGAPTNTDYAHGATFNITFSFTQNSYAQYIKRTGNVIELHRTVGQATGTDVAKTANNMVAAATGSTLDIILLGGSEHGGNVSIPADTPWFGGYSYPNMPAGGNAAIVVFSTYLNNPSGGGISHPLEFDIIYQVDAGQFNPTLTEHVTTAVISRAETIADYDVEWHDNSSYTNLVGVGSANLYSNPGETHSLFMRWRVTGAIGWTNYGQVDFFDPR